MQNLRETWLISLAALFVSAAILAVFLLACKQSPVDVLPVCMWVRLAVGFLGKIPWCGQPFNAYRILHPYARPSGLHSDWW